MIKITQHKPGINKKLVPRYKGPYQIKKFIKEKSVCGDRHTWFQYYAKTFEYDIIIR